MAVQKKNLDLSGIMSGVAESVNYANSGKTIVSNTLAKERTEAKSIKFDAETCDKLEDVKRWNKKLYGKDGNHTIDSIIYNAVIFWLDQEYENLKKKVEDL